jgi:hypothetical protein
MPRSREEFLRDAAIEATKLERFARQLREGKWDDFHIEEAITRNGRGGEKATVFFRASRMQKAGTGLDVTLDEETPPG